MTNSIFVFSVRHVDVAVLFSLSDQRQRSKFCVEVSSGEEIILH